QGRAAGAYLALGPSFRALGGFPRCLFSLFAGAPPVGSLPVFFPEPARTVRRALAGVLSALP
ncbi:unnamed protein product, partial [Amoebophrya sp. A120]